MAEKTKSKAIKHSASVSMDWPQSITPFEFLVPHSLENCISFLRKEQRWHHSRRSIFSENPYYFLLQIHRPLPDIAHFTIKLATYSRRTTTLFQGTLEALNDGSTAVRGSMITLSPMLGYIVLIGTAAFVSFILGMIEFLLFGVVITVMIFVEHNRTQRAELRKIEAYLEPEH